MPSRADFHAEKVPSNLLACIALADVIRDVMMNFRWRLVGTEITTALNRDVTGRYFDELYGAGRTNIVTPTFQNIAEHKVPLHWQGNAKFADKSWVEFEALGLPLSEDGNEVNKIMVGFVFGESKIAT